MASNYRSFQTGLRTNELKLAMDFFKYLQTAGATFFKVTFFMNQQIAGTVINGTSSQIYKINQPPSGGSCSIDLPSGTALLTYYTITCTGWTDSDGSIQSYEYYCKFNQAASRLRLSLVTVWSLIFLLDTSLDNLSPIALNYNNNGAIRLQLPQGPASDSYKISITVKIIDDSNGVQTYNIPGKVQVLPNVAQTQSIMDSMVAVANGVSTSLNTFMQELASQNVQMTAQNIISFTSVLNDMSKNVIIYFLKDQTIFSVLL